METEGISNGALRALLRDSLELWRVKGRVVPAAPAAGAEGAVPAACLRAADGTEVWIERLPPALRPLRWRVRWRPAGTAPGSPEERRGRSSPSIIGLMRNLREAVAPGQTSVRVRFGPAADAPG
ncbi:MAG: hypothetical protein IT557_08285 [Alphaproteobacteria bacterium]|nr:hypothetical protein [Alphaproteobacteria bacterium]